MSMTREEAIVQIKGLKKFCEGMADSDESGSYVFDLDVQALDLALSALRPVSREQVEKVFPGCPYCDMAKANDNIYNKALWVKEAETSKWTLAGKSLQYCPICGRPLTDEAVEMVMERLEKLKNEIG